MTTIAASPVRCAVVIAPFAPDHPAEHLGASQKITVVISLLRRLGYAVNLVDSSHTERQFGAPIHAFDTVVGAQPIVLWRPPRVPNRPIGKLLNWAVPGAMIKQLSQLQPSLIWLYNPYAYEGRVGLSLQRSTGARLLLELEDLPLARGRGISPKPRLDHWYFGRLLKHADHVTYVNSHVQRQHPPQHGTSLLFPSILDEALCRCVPATRFAGATNRLGYFGGLELEKGCGTLLELLPRLPAGWRLVVTGAGTLESAFREAERLHPERLEFHGRVDRKKLLQLMLGSDAIINPHMPIAAMDDGVFPFKVCEALATGALLISTRLPPIELPLERTVLEYDGTVNGLLVAVSVASGHYRAAAAEIDALRQRLLSLYSEDALLGRLDDFLSLPVNAAGAESAGH
ncbi:MAG: glycosyltransferase [Pseudomonadota bacterium]